MPPWLALALLRTTATATRAVPRRSAEPLCRAAGVAWFALDPGQRAAVTANLRQILGRAPRPSQVLDVFQHGALNYWDTFALPQLSAGEVQALVDVAGWEHLDAALALGRGAILAGAHLSSVGLAGQAVAARGYRLLAVVEPMRPPQVFAFMNGLRSTFGARLVPAGPSAVRELLGALRRNEVVGLVSDRHVTGTGVQVDFFGAPTMFTDGPATLALRTGAPILPAVAVRRPEGGFQGWIEPALSISPSGSVKEDALTLTQALARRLQYHIAGHPTQWTVFQRRWPES